MKSIILEKAAIRQSGNAMMYVLLGIVLFAALTFTLTRTTKSTGNASMETATLSAQQIISYAEKVNGAVQNVMLQNGCLATQVSFYNATVAGYTTSSAGTKCNIYDLAGGGMNFEAPSAGALDTAAAGACCGAGALVGNYFFTGNVCIDKVGTGVYPGCATDGISTDKELLLILPWVTSDVCSAINKILNNPSTMPQNAAGSFDTTQFTGAFAANGYAIVASTATAYPTGCFQSTGAATSPGIGYHFYMTLIAR